MLKYCLKLFIVSFFLLGCNTIAPQVSQTKIEQLSKLLALLDRSIPQDEARELSKEIFYKTQQLTQEFKMVSPPQFHNFLVNVGIREKGLCYHWSDALYLYLSEKNYDAFEFHLVGANIGDFFYEHNALVVVGKGGNIQEGVIIDPWRKAGELYFSKMGDDTEYIWHHRPLRGCD